MHRIGYLLSEGFQVMAIATQSVFECANVVAGSSFYEIENYSVQGGEVRSSLAMGVGTLPAPTPARSRIDTWMVAGVLDPLSVSTPAAVVAFLRRASGRARRVAGICTGGFVLAEAGLLDGRRATTHWFYARELQQRFPDVRVEDDRIYIVDGPIWTSAGMTAGLDLALAMVERDRGAEAAR